MKKDTFKNLLILILLLIIAGGGVVAAAETDNTIKIMPFRISLVKTVEFVLRARKVSASYFILNGFKSVILRPRGSV